jgi:hypothetical protein
MTTKYDSPPLPEDIDFVDWCNEIQQRVASDPGDSTATTIAELVSDFNTLLANFRSSGQIE